MITRRILKAALIALSLAACGGEDSATSFVTSFVAPAADPADVAAMRRLVPADALLVFGAPSLAAADAALADLTRDLGASGNPSLLEGLAGFVPGSIYARFVDPSRPLLVALGSISLGQMPMPVVILPVTDVKGFAVGMGDATLHEDGPYVGVSLDGGYLPGGELSPLSETLPAGHFALRADLAELLRPLRPAAEGLAMLQASAMPPGAMGGLDPVAMMKSYVKLFFDGLEAIESCELGLTFEDGTVLMEGQLTVTQGSALADVPAARCDELDDMVGWLDGDAAMQMVFAMDSRALMDATHSLVLDTMDIWHEADEDMMLEYLATLQVVASRCGHVFVSDAEFSAGGMNMTYLFEAEDSDALADALIDSMVTYLALTGAEASEVTESIADGRRSLVVSVDMSALLDSFGGSDPGTDAMMRSMYGEDGTLHYVATADDGRLLMTGGARAQDASARLDAPRNAPPAEVVEALRGLEGMHTRMVMRMDYGRMMRNIADMLRTSPELMDMPGMEDMPLDAFEVEQPVPLTMWCGGKGRSWSFGSSLDLAGMVEMFRSLER